MGLATGLPRKTIGLVGFGRLGAMTGYIAKIAFDMNVICWSRSLTQSKADEQATSNGLPSQGSSGKKTFRVLSKDHQFMNADFVSIHYVLSESSRGIVGSSDLAHMKSTAYLVNTSRSPLVEESALLEVLRAGKIGGAALDVFDVEPLPLESEWRTTEWGKGGSSDVLLSPHMGYVEEEVVNNWYEENVDNVRRWMDGDSLLHKLN